MAVTQVKTRQQVLVSDHLDFNGKKGINGAAGVLGTDFVILSQLQGIIAGRNDKPAARVATTGAETYTIVGGTVTQITGTTVDGVTLAVDDRIVIKDAPSATGAGAGAGNTSTTQPANGIYRVTVVGANLTVVRADDMDAWVEVPAAYVWVMEGATNADTAWIVTTDNTGTLGTTAITWILYASATALIAGAGLNKTGNSIFVGTASSSRIVVNADDIDLATVGQSNGTGIAGITFAQSVAVDAYGRVTGVTSADVRDATTTLKGIASFDTNKFTVTAGAVTIKTGSIGNGDLVNSTITVGTTSIALGAAGATVGSPGTGVGLTTPYIAAIYQNSALTNLLTLPAASDTLVGRATTDTLTNKSMSGSTNTFTNIANASLVNSSITLTAGTGVSISASPVSLGGSTTISINSGTNVTTLTGTTNQVNVSNGGVGAVTLSTPQDIHTGASPTFAKLILTAGSTVVSDPIIYKTQTWNAGGITFIGEFMNITSTASAVGSKFVEYQLGGVAQFAIRKDGAVVFGSWQASAVTEIYGGTAQTTYTTGDMLYASASNTLSKRAIGTTGQVLVVAGGIPTWNTISIGAGSTSITGVLPIANGGTALSTAPTAGQLLIGTTGGAYALNTLTQGTGIIITSASGSITIAADGSATMLTSNRVTNEVPATGTINGSNAVFTVNATPVNGSGGVSTLQVFVNGVLMNGNSNDYALSAGTTVTFQSGAIPQTGDVILFSYWK